MSAPSKAPSNEYNYYKVKYSAPKIGKKKAPASQQKAILAVPCNVDLDVSSFKVTPVFKPLNVLQLMVFPSSSPALYKVVDDNGRKAYVEGTPEEVTKTYSNVGKPGFPTVFTVERLHLHVATSLVALQSFICVLDSREGSLATVTKELDELRKTKKEILSQIKATKLRVKEIDGAVDAAQRLALQTIVGELGLGATNEAEPSARKKTVRKRREDTSSEDDDSENSE